MNCLNYLRLKYGVSQELLSSHSGVCRDYISRIENSKVKPSYKTKDKIAAAFSDLTKKQLTIEDIF